MRTVQRQGWPVALCLAVTVAAFAEDTSKKNRIIIKCPRATVRVRIFDDRGRFYDEVQLPVVNQEAMYDDRQNATAGQRYVMTSASKGCVRGESDTDATNAPIHVFSMPCNPEAPIDLLLTANPTAKFTVHRRVPNDASTACLWDELDLNDGAPIAYVTSDQHLVIEGAELNGKRKARLELDWSKVRTKTTFLKPAYPGQHTAEPSGAAKALALKSITIVPQPSP